MDDQSDLPPIPRARAAVVVAAFLLLIATGPWFRIVGPEVKTLAARPFPEWSTQAFLDGRWTEQLRLHLRETSPVTAAFRGVWSEALFLAGLLEPPVTIGAGGAMFAPWAVNTTYERVDRQRPERTAFLRELVAWTAARGVRVLCAVVPDKVRAIPERLYPDGRLPEPKAGAYAAILAELRGAGLEVVDLADAMVRWRAETPDVALYYERDTHWSPAGAWRTARLLARRLDELGWIANAPPAPVVGLPLQEVDARQDLAEMLAFPASGALAERLRDTWGAVTVRLARPTGLSAPLPEDQPDAAVAVCGDSFAAGGMAWALPAATGLVVDRVGAVAAKGPLHGLLDTLGRIARGELGARVVVWVFIERSHAEDHWVPAPTLPR